MAVIAVDANIKQMTKEIGRLISNMFTRKLKTISAPNANIKQVKNETYRSISNLSMIRLKIRHILAGESFLFTVFLTTIASVVMIIIHPIQRYNAS